MREIKFRAWSGDTMFSWDEIYIYDGLACLKDEYDHIGIGHENHVMQFTGLHDKNGREIYEGDVLICCFATGKEKTIIEYKDGCFWVSQRELIEYRDMAYDNLYRHNSDSEVIGNIYENPEQISRGEATHD